MATQQSLPPCPSGSAEETKFINTFLALISDSALARISAMARTSRVPEESLALFTAESALLSQARKDYRLARQAGELLFCWHGTCATEVAA